MKSLFTILLIIVVGFISGVFVVLQHNRSLPIDPPIGMGIAYNGKEWKFVHTGGANSFNTYASRAEAVAAAWCFSKADAEREAQPPFTNLYATPKPVETVTVHVSTNSLDYTAYKFREIDQILEYYDNNQLSMLRSLSNCLETLNAFEERIKELERERKRSYWDTPIIVTNSPILLTNYISTNTFLITTSTSRWIPLHN